MAGAGDAGPRGDVVDTRSLKRAGAIAGALAVAGNVAGVVVLGPIPSAYRPDEMTMWATQTIAAPAAASVSGVAFTLGVIALAAWSVVLARALGTTVAAVGAFLTTAGAVLNAAGTLAPLVVAHLLAPACGATDGCLSASIALLGLSLALDALFNLLLGVGLLAFGRGMMGAGWPMWLSVTTMAAGIASIPVSAQIVSPVGSDLLKVAGPLWLFVVAATSLRLWRGTS